MMTKTMKNKTEIWKSVKDFPDYEVSNQGRVRSYNRSPAWRPAPKILKLAIVTNGYCRIRLYKQGKGFGFPIHRLILETFIGSRPSGCEANHKNGIKTDNRAENLEWTTHGENLAYSFQIGLRDYKGVAHPKAVLKDEDVLKVRRLAKQGIKQLIIAKIFNVSPKHIGNIVHRRKWSHI